MRACWWLLPTLLAGCAAPVAPDEPPSKTTGALHSALDDLAATHEAGGCLEMNLWSLVHGADFDVGLFLNVSTNGGADAPRSYEAGETFSVDLATATGGDRVSMQIGPDLHQNGPCSHTPFDVDDAGDADLGTVSLTVTGYDPLDEAAGGPVATVDVVLDDVQVVLDDAGVVEVPNLTWTGARVSLVSE